MKSAVLAGLAYIAASAQPPLDRSVADWASEERIISRVESRLTGPWKHDRFPVAREIHDACSLSDPSEIIAIRGSAQTIKSEVAKNTIGSFIVDNPRGILVVMPSNDEVSRYERTKLDPMIRACPTLKRRVYGSEKASNRKSTTIKMKEFRDGFINIVPAGTSKGFQMITVGLIVCEEVSEYPDDTGGRGHAFDQAKERGTQYEGELKVVVPATPGLAGRREDGTSTCKITELFEAGDQRWIFWECPHCADHFRMRFHHMSESEGRAVIHAPCCGAQIEHGSKRAMNETARFVPTFERVHPDDETKSNLVPWAQSEDGKIIMDVIAAKDFESALTRDTEGRDKSFHIWRGQSPFSSWSSIWKKWKTVETKPDQQKPFWQQFLGEPFEAAIDTPDDKLLFEARGGAPDAKSSPVRQGRIPNWAGIVTIAADVQGNYLEWAAYAHGPNRMSACIDNGVINYMPTQPQAWIELGKVFSREWESTHLRPQKALRMGVDAGYKTNEVYKFVASNPRIHALMGLAGRAGQKEPLWQESRKGGKFKSLVGGRTIRVPLILLNTHQIKKIISAGLQNGLDAYLSGEIQPGFTLFFHDQADSNFFKQITNEYFKADPLKQTEDWIKRGPNEQLDLAVYNHALAGIEGAHSRMTDTDWVHLFEREAIDPMLVNMTPLEKMIEENKKLSDALPKPDGPTTSVPDWLKRQAKIGKRDQ